MQFIFFFFKMEEADVLCTKIGIITDGILRCIGA